MQGCTVMWVPGTDHAGIATQVIVEKNLRGTTGQTRKDIGREKFLDIISKWKDEKMEKINSQLRQLGASVDWSRYVFTMDSVSFSLFVRYKIGNYIACALKYSVRK